MAIDWYDNSRAVDLWQKEVICRDIAGTKTLHFNPAQQKAVVQTTFDAAKCRDAAQAIRENNRDVKGFGRHVATIPYALLEHWNHVHADRIQGNCITESANHKLLMSLLNDPDNKFLRTDK